MSGLTKFFYSTMKNAPALNSDWGSLLEVIRACNTGFNEQPISNITINDGIATATLNSGHGFIPYQIVTITGANQTVINGEHRVSSITNSTITFATTATNATGTMTVKTAGIGWMEKFSGDKKAIFEPKDKFTNPFLLRIDNSMPAGYDTTWAKFARVTLLEGAKGIDDFAGFAKAPQLNGDNVNEQGNGTTGAGGVYGWAKWYHGVQTYSTLYEANGSGQANARDWVIVATDSDLYFLPQITDLAGRAEYTFASVETNSSTDKWAGFLSASENKNPANSGQYYYNDGRNSIGSRWWSHDTRGKWLLRPYNGIGTSSVNCGLFSLNVGNNQQISGRNENISFPNKPDNGVVLHDIYVKDSDGIRGTLPIVKWIHNHWLLNDKAILDKANGRYVIIGTDYANEGMTSFLAFKLEG